MPIKEQEIFGSIEAIGDHFRLNIFNRHLRNILLHMPLDKGVWDNVEKLIEISDYTRLQGYRYDELYEQIYSMAVFISQVRKTVLPGLKGGSSSAAASDRDKILRDMAVSNLGSNLGILADKINELFLKVIELDKQEHPTGKKEYDRIPELAELGRLLVS
ncbi:MAG: hypothetical protein JW760_01850 [Spirochaetales bacterium]|nr:hypothetical protein [Spirochaetales bacterium]